MFYVDKYVDTMQAGMNALQFTVSLSLVLCFSRFVFGMQNFVELRVECFIKEGEPRKAIDLKSFIKIENAG